MRVIATWNGREPDPPIDVPANAVLVPWLSYAQDDAGLRRRGLPRRPRDADARARPRAVPVVVCPAAGDMAENASRVDWAGVGVRLPRRFATPRGVRAAVGRVLGEPAITRRARALRGQDGAARAVGELEAWALVRDPGVRLGDERPDVVR